MEEKKDDRKVASKGKIGIGKQVCTKKLSIPGPLRFKCPHWGWLTECSGEAHFLKSEPTFRFRKVDSLSCFIWSANHPFRSRVKLWTVCANLVVFVVRRDHEGKTATQAKPEEPPKFCYEKSWGVRRSSAKVMPEWMLMNRTGSCSASVCFCMRLHRRRSDNLVFLCLFFLSIRLQHSLSLSHTLLFVYFFRGKHFNISRTSWCLCWESSTRQSSQWVESTP